MPEDTQHAWTVYATQLFPQGYGYPLWLPEPDPCAAREVDIADVGWMDGGGFFQLFNARIKEKGSQMYKDAPEDFVPFDPPNLIVSGPNKSETATPPLCSQTVKIVNASGSTQINTGATPLASAGGSFSFKCRDNQGAILMFSPGAYSTKMRSTLHIKNYIREHAASWVQFAEKYGLELKEHDILFICGMTKTARWAVTAFQGNCKKKEGRISADLGVAGNLNVSVSISNESLPQTHQKVGPSRAPPAEVAFSESSESASTCEEPNDQCIFIHYYQMKRRIGWFRKFKAARGPHELPPPAPDKGVTDLLADNLNDDAEDDDEFEQTMESAKPYNPVNHLLDYILENSDAPMAIASTLDLYALFEDQAFPMDIPAALASLKPQIQVDENSVGTLTVRIEQGCADNDEKDADREFASETHVSPDTQESIQDASVVAPPVTPADPWLGVANAEYPNDTFPPFHIHSELSINEPLASDNYNYPEPAPGTASRWSSQSTLVDAPTPGAFYPSSTPFPTHSQLILPRGDIKPKTEIMEHGNIPSISPPWHSMDVLPIPSVSERAWCQWQNCQVCLDDSSHSGIRRHFRDFHSQPRSSMVCCKWGNCRSGEMLYDNIAKHIAECHLKSMRKTCGSCGNSFTRNDTFKRHLNAGCPAAARRQA